VIISFYAETEQNLKEQRWFYRGDSDPCAPEYELLALFATSLWWAGITIFT
jgi:hypothetical protein